MTQAHQTTEKNYVLPNKEVEYLRYLASKMRAIAELPVMKERENLWRNTNDGVPGTPPPIVLESRTFDREFLPTSLLKCESTYGQKLERYFLRHIRHLDIFNDDHVCPKTLDMHWHIWYDEFGIEIPVERVKDSEGYVTAYHFDCPIKDLATDGYDMVKPARFDVDREETMAEKAFLEESFGDILSVVIRSGVVADCDLTKKLLRLMSQEAMFMAVYDCPEKLQGFLGLLHDNTKRMCKWAEREGLLVLNNDNECVCGSCYTFTSLLPKRKIGQGKVALKDMWADMDSQETVGLSPAMFHDIFFPFYKDLAELFGFVYWGCCEPADQIWEQSISHLPNLKAVSISPWANEAFMADILADTDIVYSRKPTPNILSADGTFNEESWAQEIRKTLELTSPRDIRTEIVVRDVYTLKGELDRASRAVKIAKEEISRFFNPKKGFS